MATEQLKLSNQVCFRLYSVSRLVIQAYRPLLDRLGITYPQYLVLMVLWENDHLLVNDIAHRLMLETNTVTPLMQRMERMGLLVRRRGKSDGRQRIVSLTKKGREMEHAARDIPQPLAAGLGRCGIPVEHVLGLVPVLDQIIEGLYPHEAPKAE